MDNETCCLGKILTVIDILQKNANKVDEIDSTCAKPYLGSCLTGVCYNTRPVTFYTCNNNLLTITYQTSTGETETSSIFRVDKVNGCCATVLILIATTTEDTTTYTSSGQYATINLNCICGLRCLPDTYISCL